MGITWWNVVDDCGAPGEPTISGIFTRDMQPKPAYHALNNLINRDWKTRMNAKTDQEGTVTFRGFKGKYRVIYSDASGTQKTLSFHLSKDGDGIHADVCLAKTPSEQAGKRNASRMTLFDSRVER